MPSSLSIRAGAKAIEIIRDEGLNPDRVKMIAAASGGPKWLVLVGIDKMLPLLFKNRKKELFFIGSSIGSWRMAALAQKNPIEAVEEFKNAYIHQRYTRKPTSHEITREFYRVMNEYLSDDAIRYILRHPFMRAHILAVRSKYFGSTDRKPALAIHLACAAAFNAFSRNALRFFFDRVLFYDGRTPPAIMHQNAFPRIDVVLTELNFRKALMASGSIPLLMEGIRHIDGAPAGTFRDGGIIDYHLDIPFCVDTTEIVLYPHFFDYIIPGWFDKGLRWRRPNPSHVKQVVLIAPSYEFVDNLPLKKIPDRKDFKLFLGKDDERIAYWTAVARRSEQMGAELMEAITSGKIRTMVQPL
ncbi:MAG: patatin-like phospholipase family protein [Spirochaetes bacterium]|nr:patatin-like phospholipase family protein [Spirochaetota bacterium]